MNKLAIDLHSHYYPRPLAKKLIESGVLNVKDEKIILTWNGRRSEATRSIIDIEDKKKELDKFQIYAVLSVPNPWTYFISDAREEVKIAKECNDELAFLSRKFPDTFGALATLPLGDIQGSIEEAERAVKELGLLGFIIGTGIKGKTIADEDFYELVKFLEKLGKPIFIHPGTLFISNFEDVISVIASFPFETTYVLLKIIQKGYNLKIIVPHGGGFIPYQLGRINLLKEVFNITEFKPEDYILNHLYFDSVLYKDSEVNFLVNTVGLDKVVFGTDHPFTVSQIEKSLSFMKKYGKRVLIDNAIQLLGL
ncbi:amidohydrolase family protein [Stygiolobus caldivivus]|uniref:Amidohydrolase-related domain-containing protein n=1 Tax=Stygiolobus caldivivus TaxID=2824673 RepID=A0A8D5UAG3_9CREN|nr:amidohydrolase family protein [Stygiolobus caldivivus]BCU71661.1 hypothetical protein KN1_29580 [Stygiolobus caldivivus]